MSDALNRFIRSLGLGLLGLAGGLLIITAPASIAATGSTRLQIRAGTCPGVISAFWSAFRSHLRRSLFAGAVLLATGSVVVVDGLYLLAAPPSVLTLAIAVALVAGVLAACFTLAWVPALLATTTLFGHRVIVVAFALGFRFPGRSLALSAFGVLAAAVAIPAPFLFPLLLCYGSGLQLRLTAPRVESFTGRIPEAKQPTLR